MTISRAVHVRVCTQTKQNVPSSLARTLGRTSLPVPRVHGGPLLFFAIPLASPSTTTALRRAECNKKGTTIRWTTGGGACFIGAATATLLHSNLVHTFPQRKVVVSRPANGHLLQAELLLGLFKECIGGEWRKHAMSPVVCSKPRPFHVYWCSVIQLRGHTDHWLRQSSAVGYRL